MPKPATGDGPWGEAISYWLTKRGWRQADLLRAVHERGAKMSKNTVSTATLGHDCSTTTLRVIAKTLNVPLDEVLVSPERRRANDDRKRIIQEAVEAALRSREELNGPPAALEHRLLDELDQAVSHREEADTGRSKKARRRKRGGRKQ